MKFNRLFILEILKKNFFKTNFILFFKFQPMAAKQWFSFRMLLDNQGIKLYTLKKRELFRFFSFEKKNFNLDSDNVCFFFSNNLSFLFKNFIQNYNLLNANGTRFFLIKANSQLLTESNFLNFFSLREAPSKLIGYSMFLKRTYHFLKLNFSSNILLRLVFRNLILKE